MFQSLKSRRGTRDLRIGMIADFYPDVFLNVGFDLIDCFRNKKRFHHQALVEIRILDHLRRRDKDGVHNVIHMLDYFYFRSHLCISFELLR